MAPVWTQTLVRILLILAHLAGLVVAVLLLVRRKGTAPVLATVAFALMVILDATLIVETTLLFPILYRRAPRAFAWVGGGLNCCWGLLALVAWGCLIAALWLMGRPETEHEVWEETSPPSG